jgi:hypothetical protein
MTASASADDDKLSDEEARCLAMLIQEAERKAEHRDQLKRWYGKGRYAIGVPLSISTAAGAIALTSLPDWCTAVAAFAATFLGAFTGLVNPDGRRRGNALLQADYRDVYRQAVFASDRRDTTKDDVQRLLDRMHEVDRLAGEVGGK